MKPLAIIAAMALSACDQGTVSVPEDVTMAEAVYDVGMNLSTSLAVGLISIAAAIYFKDWFS